MSGIREHLSGRCSGLIVFLFIIKVKRGVCHVYQFLGLTIAKKYSSDVRFPIPISKSNSLKTDALP